MKPTHNFIVIETKEDFVDWMPCEPFLAKITVSKCSKCGVVKEELPICLGQPIE